MPWWTGLVLSLVVGIGFPALTGRTWKHKLFGAVFLTGLFSVCLFTDAGSLYVCHFSYDTNNPPLCTPPPAMPPPPPPIHWWKVPPLP